MTMHNSRRGAMCTCTAGGGATGWGHSVGWCGKCSGEGSVPASGLLRANTDTTSSMCINLQAILGPSWGTKTCRGYHQCTAGIIHSGNVDDQVLFAAKVSVRSRPGQHTSGCSMIQLRL